VNVGKSTRDLAIGFGSQTVFKLLGFIVLALLARQLSQDDYGKLMFALSLTGVAVLLTDLGASNDLIRRVAAAPDEARRRIEGVLSARLPLMAAYFVFVCAWVGLTKPELLPVVASIAVYAALKDSYRSYASLFLGLHRIAYTVVAFGVHLLVLVMAIALGTALNRGLPWMTGSYLLAGLVLLGVSAYIARRSVGPLRLRFGWSLMKSVFGGSMFLFALGVLSQLQLSAGTLMLGYMTPYAEVARYEVAARLLEASQFMVRAVTLILFPICVALAAKGRWDELRVLTHKMLAGVTGLGLATSGVTGLLAAWIIRIVYTSAYDESAVVLRVLYLGVPGLYVATIGTFLAASMHREKRAVLAMAIGVALNIALNLWVIPRHGALGAAWVSVFSQSLVAVWLTFDAYAGLARGVRALPGEKPPLETGLELGGE
jgi:O-antigen/teichoic acid export membrane protein